jgi:2-aminoadipate transaminase
MRDLLPTTQTQLRPGVIELSAGEPDPALLPAGLIQAAAERVLDTYGPGALAYGGRPGPLPLRAALAARISAREGRLIGPDEVYVTGGNSQALELVLTVFTRPGDVVLVEAPTYNLALGTMRDHPVELVGVALDEAGLDVGALEARLTQLKTAGRIPRFLYTIPTFHNPTGACLAGTRRRRLLELALEHELIVVEDDVYRELAYDHAAPAALWAADPAAPVIRLGSFSKSLAPGLRVGWLTARADLLQRFDAAGMLDSGGNVTQFAACIVAALLAGGGYDEHTAALRTAYTARRDVLAAGLREHLPPGCRFATPGGGFFIWVELPAGVRSRELLPVAEAHGVSFVPGGGFFADDDDGHLRLSFCLYGEAELAEAARRLGAALRRHLGRA